MGATATAAAATAAAPATGIASMVNLAGIQSDVMSIGGAAIGITLAIVGFRVAKRLIHGV